MMAYIHNYCTISCIDSFHNGILSNIENPVGIKLKEPDYNAIIPAGHLRRMSRIVKMGAAAAMKATEKISRNELEGIILATGFGCYLNTVEFTKEIIYNPDDALLAPAGFIQSTDNTIAGQLGLIFKNNNYNTTYNHKGIAFENALLDALMLINETNGHVLVGAVDELLPQLYIKGDNTENYKLTEGSSFFLINNKAEGSAAKIEGVSIHNQDQEENIELIIADHIKKGHLPAPDLILYGNSFLNKKPVPAHVSDIKVIDYSALSGIYLTNISFGLQLAIEILNGKNKFKGLAAKNILLVNNYNDQLTGLIRVIK